MEEFGGTKVQGESNESAAANAIKTYSKIMLGQEARLHAALSKNGLLPFIPCKAV